MTSSAGQALIEKHADGAVVCAFDGGPWLERAVAAIEQGVRDEIKARVEDALDWIEHSPDDASHVLANVSIIREGTAT